MSKPEVCEVLALLGMSRHEHKDFKLLCNSQNIQGNLLSVDSALQVLSSFGIVAFVQYVIHAGSSSSDWRMCE